MARRDRGELGGTYSGIEFSVVLRRDVFDAELPAPMLGAAKLLHQPRRSETQWLFPKQGAVVVTHTTGFIFSDGLYSSISCHGNGTAGVVRQKAGRPTAEPTSVPASTVDEGVAVWMRRHSPACTAWAPGR